VADRRKQEGVWQAGDSRKVHCTAVPGGLKITPQCTVDVLQCHLLCRSRPSVLPGNPSSRGGGSLEGPPRLCSSRGILCFSVLGLLSGGDRFLVKIVYPAVVSATFSHGVFL
jgi:hypothetical protein